MFERLMEKLKQEEERITSQPGRVVLFGPGGPASLEFVKELIEVVKQQQEEIEELKRRVNPQRAN